MRRRSYGRQSCAFDKSVITISITPLPSKHFLQRSTSLERECCVLYPSLKAHKWFDNFSLVKGSICECFSLSNILIGKRGHLLVENFSYKSGHLLERPVSYQNFFRLSGKLFSSNDSCKMSKSYPVACLHQYATEI